MNYFVVDPTGQKYGPASVDVLNGWIQEDRLAPNSLLEDAATGQRMPASQVPGLQFPNAAPQTPPMGQMPSNPPGPVGAPQQFPGPGQGPGAPQGQFSAPPGFQGSPYQRPDFGMNSAQAQKKVTTAWIMGSLGLICCPLIFSVVGIVVASQAEQMGHPQAKNAKIFCFVTLVLGLAIGVMFQLGRR